MDFQILEEIFLNKVMVLVQTSNHFKTGQPCLVFEKQFDINFVCFFLPSSSWSNWIRFLAILYLFYLHVLAKGFYVQDDKFYWWV